MRNLLIQLRTKRLSGTFSNCVGIKRALRHSVASFAICSLLMPIFAAAVAAESISSPYAPRAFAAAAENSILSDTLGAFEHIGKAIEGLTDSTSSGGDVPDDHVRSESDRSEGADARAEHAGNEPNAVVHSNESAKRFATLNDLPENERESVYTYENNLGSPKGQTEGDSPYQPPTLPIRHRAGIANFNFSVPLASLSGRGLDAGASITYNSRTWNRSCAEYNPNPPYGCSQYHFTYDVEDSWIAPGFSTGFGYLDATAVPQSTHPTNNSGNFTYYTAIVPRGIVDPDGTRHPIGCVSSEPILGTYEYRCTAYRSSDGTFIRVNAANWYANPGNSQSVDLNAYNYARFMAVYPNGMKVSFSGGFGTGNDRKQYPVIVQDSNGNRIRINYRDTTTGRLDYITDTLNRKIKFYYENDAYGSPDKLVAVTVPGMGTGEEIQTVRFYYEDMNLTTSGKFNGQVTAPSTVRVLRYIYMPSTRTGYEYEYHPNYGMIKRIERHVGMMGSTSSTSSTGTLTEGTVVASTEYNFPDGSSALNDVPKYTKRTDDWAGRDSNTPQAETFYDVPNEGLSKITTRTTDYDIVTENVTDTQTGLLQETSLVKRWGTENPLSHERPNSALMAKTKYFWSSEGERNLTKIEFTNDAGLTKATKFYYDGYNNQTKVEEYGYAAPGSLGTLLRTTETTYETGAGWINGNLLGLAKSVKTTVDGAVVSKTEFLYDHDDGSGVASDLGTVRRDNIDILTHDSFYNPAYPEWDETICPVEGGGQNLSEDGCTSDHHDGYSSASFYRGNITKVTRFSNAALTSDPNADVTDYNFDIAGNLVSATLSCCNLKTISYSKNEEYAFPRSETKGRSPTQLTTSVTYNRNTGLVLKSTNENGQETNYEYETDTLRLKKTSLPNGGYTLTEYSDQLESSPPAIGYVRTTTTLETNKTVQSYGYFDGQGLQIRSATQTPDGWSISAAEYDELGRLKKSYNPFYGTAANASIPTGTKYTEVTGIDALGRTTDVKLQDDTTVSTAFSTASQIPSGFNKTFVTVTDQAGKQRRQVMDSLGRIVRVDEPDANGSLGAVNTPTQPTYYEFDGNDNLTKVTQSDGTTTQERKFFYDSLSRLVAERQVEASPTLELDGTKLTPDPSRWTKVLKYNSHGLLEWGMDARGVKTSFVYDGLNRVQSVTYTGETGYQTPAVTYTYDQARTGYYNAGALTRVETAAVGDTPATAAEFDYDLMGRVKMHRQWIGSQEYDLEYGYNLAGQLVTEKYPSGRIVSTGYDTNGRLSNIGDASRTYLAGLEYHGNANSLNKITLGNGTVQNITLNDRLQLKEQELKRGSETLQKYSYDYGVVDPSTGNVDVSKNNGQLGQIKSWIGATQQWSQRFVYDSIGRLTESREYKGSDDAHLTYRQHFDFDRFGNLYRKQANNQVTGQENPLPYTAMEDSDISKATNRFTAQTTYDEAGQVITDNKFRGMGFGYDANGRMVKATEANQPDALSVYDAAGMRVAECVNNLWKFSIYDIGGKMVAEYGGLQSTDEGGVRYVLQDWQGSTRAIVNKSGFVNARLDYTAFGEEINAGVGLRTAAQGFGSNNTPSQKYALTERDQATGLDHAWFRKNENQAGRWTSPDPYGGSMDAGDPQSFNRFSYVSGQPTNYVDPSGLNEIHYACWDVITYVDTPNGRAAYATTQCVFFGGGGSVPTGHSGPPIDEGPGGGFSHGPPTKEKIGRAWNALQKCLADAKLSHEKRLRELNKKWSAENNLSIIQDIRKLLFVTAAGIVWEATRVAGKFVLKRLVAGAGLGVAIQTGAEAVYMTGGWAADLFAAGSEYGDAMADCHESIESYFQLSFRRNSNRSNLGTPLRNNPRYWSTSMW